MSLPGRQQQWSTYLLNQAAPSLLKHGAQLAASCRNMGRRSSCISGSADAEEHL